MIGAFKILAIAGAVTGAVAMAQPARADHVSFGIGVGIGGSNFRSGGYYQQNSFRSPVYNHGYGGHYGGGYYGGGSYGGGFGSYYGGYSYQPYYVPSYYAAPVYYPPAPVYYQPSPAYYYQPGGVIYSPVPAFYRPQPRLTFGFVGRW